MNSSSKLYTMYSDIENKQHYYDAIVSFMLQVTSKDAIPNDDYYNALSVVKGIYMIIDGNTGKLYIGSAYGSDGIWGRWSSYAATCHGGNYELQKLYDENGEEYFYKFKYIILQILPMRMSDKEVIEMESKYKNRYLTREFGLNDN